MLTPILPSDIPGPKPATTHVANQQTEAPHHASSQAGLASISAGREVPQTDAAWMSARLRMAEAAGEIVKLTGRRSISSPGGDAA